MSSNNKNNYLDAVTNAKEKLNNLETLISTLEARLTTNSFNMIEKENECKPLNEIYYNDQYDEDNINRKIKKLQNQKNNVNSQLKNLTRELKCVEVNYRTAGYNFVHSGGKNKEAEKDMNLYLTDVNRFRKLIDERQKRLDEIQSELDETIKANKDALKRYEKERTDAENCNKEYEKLEEEKEKILADLNKAKEELAALGYTGDDLENIQILNDVKELNSIANRNEKYGNVAAIAIRNDWQNESNGKLEDLRSLPGMLNFRGYGNVNKNYDKSMAMLKHGGQAVSPSRSYYMNEDYLFTDTMMTPTLNSNSYKFKPEIQTLILNEFQPYDVLTIGDLLPEIPLKAGGFFDDTFKLLGSFISIAKTPLINYTIDETSKNTGSLYHSFSNGDPRKRRAITKDPVQQIQNMFNGGKWLNTFELPFWGDDYLIGNFADNWAFGSAEGSVGETIGGLVKQFGVDYPSNPKFVPSMMSTRNEIKTSFYLINSSSQWLRKNFEFIQAIFAGTSWLHMKYCLIRPTNVYHVLCPGRFQIYWAAMDSEITFCGKLRKNKNVSEQLRKLGINSIDPDEMLWPDAWKITLTIKDLTPNNFNNYAEYYMNGFNEVEVASLAYQLDAFDVVNQLPNYLKELIDDHKEIINKFADDVKKQIPNALSGVGQSIKDVMKPMLPAETANKMNESIDEFTNAIINPTEKKQTIPR